MILRRSKRLLGRAGWVLAPLLVIGVVQPVMTTATAAPAPQPAALRPVAAQNVAFDVSPAARSLSREAPARTGHPAFPNDPGPTVLDTGFAGDSAVQTGAVRAAGPVASAAANFEGISNADNAVGLVSPPDPVGDVGPNHYVEMVNLSFAIYSKTGVELVGPTPIGNLWAGFAVNDCTGEFGDPIVLHDQLADRWILTQLTNVGPTYYNCVAISTSPDPTGTYFRYAFSTGNKFPDYPKFGVWPDAYYVSNREFGPAGPFTGVGAYALERSAMLAGNPTVRVVKFNLAPGATPYLPGDGLLPTDLDGSTLPPPGTPNYYVGTQDDGGPYGAPSDALNIWEFKVNFATPALSSFTKTATLPVPAFDSIFPCGGSGRSCIAQPNTTQKIDIQSYRQRPIWRLAYRNFGTFQSLVTNQSVEARPGIAGVRWYEIRNPSAPVLRQASTYAPNDSVNRWMGSIAMDRRGNMALGFSVSNGTTVFPGIRYTGRLSTDPVSTMRPIERVLIAGTGSQLGSERWGDYTSMNVDPTDDCTFWYINEYVKTTGQVNWTTRIGSFTIPGC